MNLHNQNEPESQQLAPPTQNALEALKILIQKIAATVEEGKREGVLRATEEPYLR